MELKRFLVLSAVLALAFTMANPAHAQFGNLLNKTKKAVEKKVKKTAKSAAEKAGVLPIEDSSISGDDGSGLTTLYKKKLTPSSEALSTDKFANDESVPKGFSKSYKQIHAAYERLDPAYFPLQPYYKYPSTYALGSDRMTLYPEAVFLEFMQKYLTNVVGSSTRKVTVKVLGYQAGDFSELISADGQKLGMQEDDNLFRYPWAAQFFADPNCKQSVWNLGMLLVNNSRSIGLVRDYAVNKNVGVAIAERDWMFPYKEGSEIRYREDMMVEMARNVVDINIVAECVLEFYQKVESEKVPFRKTLFMLAGNEMYKNVLSQHKNFDANQSKFNQQLMYYTRYYNTPEYSKIIDASIVMPEPETVALKAGAMDPQLNAQILRIMKQKDPSIIRVVVINDSWAVHTLKDRAVMVWGIYKNKQGKLEAHDYSFCQDYQGGGKYGALRYKGIGVRTVYVK
ncbi:hypothetical protein HMPREF9332_00307 [Alloprevotella rava F0323]|uniref:Uncharacterized protein n=1 Tax=Alloprevotella rava F0323 TaxID=679199 RepID=G5G9Q6_9BACT|nr:hypothetical protein [Alloprevotella rava]EHG24106.1 hypothetical protein HMPREF9332_00307 [Alloprevotella rava F0323]